MTALERNSLTVSIPIQIRIATRADLPKMEWYGLYTHQRNLFRRAYREQQLGRRLILIADSNHFPVGQLFIQFVSMDSSIADGGNRAYLYSLRVMEMFRGYGIGTCLLQEAQAIIQDRGYEWSTIGVAKDNTQARRLYERLGYRVFAEDPGRWSYIDHEGRTRHVNEPCWLLQKQVIMR
jgi:ribosomal protein S18 acetylase RimI-like enzyme